MEGRAVSSSCRCSIALGLVQPIRRCEARGCRKTGRQQGASWFCLSELPSYALCATASKALLSPPLYSSTLLSKQYPLPLC
jgi:hypothetical protein